ncbi:MAG: SLBB domain-containing protein, partial [Bacteroidaceae bacterium]|nr:SLBB domain-containing protein [Bacteroidaceae bacterium]
PTSTEEVDSLSQVFSFEITDLFALKEKSDFVLQPYDQVYVRRSPGYSAQAHVKLEGEVTFPGAYVLKNKNTRLSDVVKLAGGTSSWAYIKGARLSRQMTEEDRMRLQSVYSSMSQLGDSISEEKLKVAEEYFVGINLEKALANPGSDADVVLREGDRLIVPEYSNTIKISGCVLHPNTVSYDSKMTVDDYINQAGGYGFKAKKSRAYIIYMNGTIAKAKKNSKAVVEPGCEIIIPEKRKNDGSGLQKVLSIATTSASLATMFGTLYNIIK